MPLSQHEMRAARQVQGMQGEAQGETILPFGRLQTKDKPDDLQIIYQGVKTTPKQRRLCYEINWKNIVKVVICLLTVLQGDSDKCLPLLCFLIIY